MRVLRLIGGLVGGLVLLGVAFYLWASSRAARTYSRVVEVHEAGFPIPFPLDDPSELSPHAADSAALVAAIDRGRHLVETRYGCADCHGKDFSGGVMLDQPVIGRLFGPNLTPGRGGVTGGYSAADWDRIVRHGVSRDGTPAAMPSESFRQMSDQELSDVVAYLGTVPPVDNEVSPVAIGPIGRLLIALGEIVPAYDRIAVHDQPHAERPPTEEPTVEFGRHLAVTCSGCHREDFGGGPIPGSDPSWPPAANLTPHADGLGDWTVEQFSTAMREGVRPDGTRLRTPMAELVAYGAGMREVELEALWAYLRSLTPHSSRK